MLGTGGSMSNLADQAPGYPVMDGTRAIAWFICREDAETFARARNTARAEARNVGSP